MVAWPAAHVASAFKGLNRLRSGTRNALTRDMSTIDVRTLAMVTGGSLETAQAASKLLGVPVRSFVQFINGTPVVRWGLEGGPLRR